MPINLIYAYGTTDDISYHESRRGTKEVNLLNYMPRSSVPDSKYFEMRVTNVQLSSFLCLILIVDDQKVCEKSVLKTINYDHCTTDNWW